LWLHVVADITVVREHVQALEIRVVSLATADMSGEDTFMNRIRIEMQHAAHIKTGRAEWSPQDSDLKGGAKSSSMLENLLLFSF
jgi:hypothetical protein